MAAMIRAPVVVLALMLASGCSDPGGSAAASSKDAGAVGTGETIAPTADGAGDLVSVGDAELVPGGFGWPCKANDECTSGWCVEGPDGNVCTESCIDSCPGGWACRPIANVGQDLIYVCVAPFARLCRPCRTDAECQGPTVEPGAHCVPFGAQGSFCGATCTGEADAASCPDGYGCQDVMLAGGSSSKQCLPVDGLCTCSPLAIELGLETDCRIENELGTCESVRRCAVGGLTSCEVHPPSPEVCDGIDNDCNGTTDGPLSSDCVMYYPDTDADGFGLGVGECRCDDPGPGFAKKGGDCNELSTAANPDQTEVCNFLDEDCDGATDEDGALGCKHYYQDLDLDGFGGDAGSPCLCNDPGEGWLKDGGDCDDKDPELSPVAIEACDGIDNDCDGDVDEPDAEGCVVYYVDTDLDGFGQDANFKCLCQKDAVYVTEDGGDCNDLDPIIKPLAPESCNAVDDDCDGVVDQPGSAGCSPFLKDADEDGFGVAEDTLCLCAAAAPYVGTVPGDCNDDAKLAYPGATEMCDGVDNDCDGAVDPPGAGFCTKYYADKDLDGHGAGEPVCLCKPSPEYPAPYGDDCQDENPVAFPGAQEVCIPGDENCNGLENEAGALGCTTYFKDGDGDGYGVSESQCLCVPDGVYKVGQTGDCYDANPDVWPGQPGWFTVQRGDGSFDYDCDGGNTMLHTQLGQCGVYFDCDTQVGWNAGAPAACGSGGSWIYDCDWGVFSGCSDDTTWQAQLCH